MKTENKTILLVEDQPITAIMNQKVLEEHGFEVICAATGEEAVEIADDNRGIDLILMDIDLGKGIDGTEAAAIILSKYDLPLVFLSSHTEPEIVNKTKSITNYGYVVKNAGEVVLIASIEMAMKLHDAHLREKEITEQLKFQAEILDQIGDHVTATDLNGVIKYVNEAECKAIGKTKEEIIGQTTDIYGEDPEFGAAQNKIIEATIKDGYWRGEVVNFDENNNRIVVDCRTWAMRDSNGTITSLVGISNNITERVKYKQKLEKNETLYRVLMEHSPDGIKLLNREGKILNANQAACDMIGYTKDELIGLSIPDIDPDWDKERFMKFWDDKISLDNAQVYTYHRHKSGALIPIEVRVIRFEMNGEEFLYGISRDLTDLRKLESQYRMLEENISDVIWTTDLNFKMTYVSPSIERLLGESAELHLSRTLEDKHFPEDIEYLMSVLTEEIEKEKDPDANKERSRLIETRLKRPDGSYIWVEFNVKFLRDKQGNIIGLQGSTRDITERRRAYESMKINQDKLTGILRAIPDILIKTNSDGEYLDILTTSGDKLYKQKEEMIGRKIAEILPDPAASIAMTGIKDAISSNSLQVVEYDLEIDNNKFYFEARIVPLNENELIALIIDITERRQAEEMLRVITDNMFDLVALTDLQGNYKFVGKSHSILGYDLDSLIGRNVMELIHPDDQSSIATAFADFINAGTGTPKVEYRLRCIDDSYIWLETMGKFIKDSGGNIKEIIFSSRDITERKQVEEKLLLALQESNIFREKSENLLKEKEIILKESNHRIKNNMHVIAGLLHLQAGNHSDKDC